MSEASERLKERTRTGRDTRRGWREALRATERLGAAMVFGRRPTIAIPDGEVALTSDSPLDLADVLADWSPDDRTLLLLRPSSIRQPSGRARFHNDNSRSWIPSQPDGWLGYAKRTSLHGCAPSLSCSQSRTRSWVIDPSLNEVAAWLALWDQDVAREIVQKGSITVATRGGRPASLPPDVRRDALTRLIKELAVDRQLPWWDNGKLQRFAKPDVWRGPIPVAWLPRECRLPSCSLRLINGSGA